MTSYYCQ